MSISNQEIIDALGNDTVLWNASLKSEAKPIDVLANKLVLFYFSAHWCGPCRRFTPTLVQLYKKLKAKSADVEDFEIVFVSMDKTAEEYKSYTNEMPWWCLPLKSPVMGKLANQYGAQGIPHLVIVDKDGSLLISDGVGEVSMDQEGKNFPWRPKPIVELMPSHYIKQDKSAHPVSELDDKYLMIYFSAHWCPPCRGFTPKLSKAYTALQSKRRDFELIFVSSDHDKSSFDEYFGEMTFCAFPFEDRQAKADLSSRLGVRGIPSLIILGPKPAGGGDRPVINDTVRSIIEHGDYISEFPFHPKTFSDLSQSSDAINKFKCLLVFHEGGDDEEQDDIKKAVTTVAESCTDKNLRFFWATSSDGMSKVVRNALNLGPVKEEPLMVLVDIPDGGSYYMSSETNITADAIRAFMDNPGEKMQL